MDGYRKLASEIASGLLTFPVTHFDTELQFDEGAYREHCDFLLQHRFAALFAAGGTGEFFSLTPAETSSVVQAAVAETAGRVPVVAGCGYGTALACEMARDAENAGADAVLLLPPYLVQASQEGLAQHVEAVCRSTRLGVILYGRDNCMVAPTTLSALCEMCPNLIGYKDGIGDIELFVAQKTAVSDRLIFIGGLPTAEVFATPYFAMGCSTYSSAIANFAPKLALQFYEALRSGDVGLTSEIIEQFVLPFVEIRNRGAGYAVAIVKAAMRITGRSAGPMRLPLQDLKPDHFRELEALLGHRIERLLS